MTDTDTVLYATQFEEAFLGLGTQFTTPLAIYDWDACARILVERDGMTEDEAAEYMDVNVTGAYVGPQTPVFLKRDRPDTTLEG